METSIQDAFSVLDKTTYKQLATQFVLEVVEPFLPSNSTYPGMPAVGEVASECLRLGDLFNIPYWNNFTNEFQQIGSMSFSPLVSWEDFLDFAPRWWVLCISYDN